MLSKATFVRALRLIQEQADIMDAVRQQLGRLGEKSTYFNIDSLHLQALLEVLAEVMEDNNDWIEWWLYEDVEKLVSWEENGEEVTADLTEPEALWDFLESNKKSYNIKKGAVV